MKTALQLLALLCGLIGELLIRPGAPRFEGIVYGVVTLCQGITYFIED